MELGQSQEVVELDKGVCLMTRAYRVVIVHDGLAGFADEVKEAVIDSTEKILSQSGVIDFREVNSCDDLCEIQDLYEIQDPKRHVVVLYLGNKAGSTSNVVNSTLDTALKHAISVLPVIRESDPGSVAEKLPKSVKLLNAVDWDEDRDRALVALRQMLGLEEAERKVFISYYREETTEVAVQLYDALSRRNFDVFLDRFSVSPGADFPEELDQELAGKAFVVLLESPGVQESRWIQHEISYALSHRIGILAVAMPSVESGSVSLVDEAFRLRLCSTDFSGNSQLTDESLERILSKIELRHAQALRRRREQLLGSLREKLLQDGGCCRPVDDWAVVASVSGGGRSVFLLTPRPPSPRDLYHLHQIRSNVSLDAGSDLQAALVHASENIDVEQESLLDWIREGRGLDVRLLPDFNLS